MTHDPTTDALDTPLAALFHATPEPDDAGFSLRVMAALPPRVFRRQRRRAAAVRWAYWVASTGAACGVAGLLGGALGTDLPHLLAALPLLALLLYWSLPAAWRGH